MDESVALEHYSRHWPSLYLGEATRSRSLKPFKHAAIEHIGSTAVPGLLAKPTIDVQVGLPSYPPEPKIKVAIRSLGYECLGKAGVSGRLYFHLRSSRSFNVHVVAVDSSHWSRNLALRNLLRTSAPAREACAAAKRAAINAGACTLIAYSAAKEPVLNQLLDLLARPKNTAQPVVEPERQRRGTLPARRCLPILHLAGKAPRRRRPSNSALGFAVAISNPVGPCCGAMSSPGSTLL